MDRASYNPSRSRRRDTLSRSPTRPISRGRQRNVSPSPSRSGAISRSPTRSVSRQRVSASPAPSRSRQRGSLIASSRSRPRVTASPAPSRQRQRGSPSPAPINRTKAILASRKKIIQSVNICTDTSFDNCKESSFDDPKWFQKRNACIYNYLKEKFIDTKVPIIQAKLGEIIAELNNKLREDGVKADEFYKESDKDVVYKIVNDIYPIFDQAMALSVLLSFLDPVADKDILDIDFFSISYNEFNITFAADDNKGFPKELGKSVDSIMECNRNWNISDANSHLFDTTKERLNLTVCLENPDYNNLKNEISFLEEIMGVIDKNDYVVQKQTKYYDEKTDELLDIDANKDNICKDYDEKFCMENPDCYYRKGKCINKQRHSSARPRKTPSNIPSYYISQNLYKIYKDTEPDYYLYVPLSNYYTVAGYSGIFERKSVRNENGNAVSTNPKQISIVFPPFDLRGEGSIKDIAAIVASGVYSFGIARSMLILDPDEGVGVLKGLYSVIDGWYKNSFLPLVTSGMINLDSEIFISGTSLGGALTNLSAFYLRRLGYTNIHYYANGAPRVGNSKFKEYMERDGNFRKDSGNFVRYINVIKTDSDGNREFITEFDPVCKFPPKDSAVPYKERISSFLPSFISPFIKYGSPADDYLISDNPKLTIVEAGLLFNPYVVGYGQQTDYEMFSKSFGRGLDEEAVKNLNIKSNTCPNHFDYIHSIPAYTAGIFNGDEANKGTIKYDWNYDSVRDLKLYPCVPKEKGAGMIGVTESGSQMMEKYVNF